MYIIYIYIYMYIIFCKIPMYRKYPYMDIIIFIIFNKRLSIYKNIYI